MATLACGLRDNSRTKLRIAKQKVSFETLLLATIADRISYLVFKSPEEAKQHSIVDKLLSDDQQADSVMSFATGEAFDARFKAITGGG